MSTQPSLAKQVLQMARNVAARRAPVSLLSPLLDKLMSAVMQAHLHFEHSARDNPELDAETVKAVLAAFHAYSQEIARMRTAAEQHDLLTIGAAAEAMEAAVEIIRGAEQAWTLAMHSGGSTWSYLNRLLAHIDYFRHGGQETRHTVSLLDGLPAFLEQLRHEVASVELYGHRAAAEVVVANLEGACNSFRNALDSVAMWTPQTRAGIMEPIWETVVDARRRLTNVFGTHVEQQLSAGPTGVVIVNAVLLAADKATQGEITLAMFEQVVEKSHAGLELLLLGKPDPLVVDAIEGVKQALDRLVATHPHAESFMDATNDLTQAAHNLSMYLTVSAMPEWDDDESVLDLMTDGGEVVVHTHNIAQPAMPPLLESLMRVGRDYLARGQPDLLIKGLEKLHASIDRFADRAARLPNDEPGKRALVGSIDLLREASESLTVLLKTHDPRALEAADWLMQQACQGLSTI